MNDLDEARDKISFGRERRKLMDDEDRKITAYHEAGHALVQALIDDGHMPVHKVTIIPRGQSLGSTMFMPKKDILNHSKRRLLNQICCGLGGRGAEEIVNGDQTSGASGDIRMVTSVARHMVCEWGMSELILSRTARVSRMRTWGKSPPEQRIIVSPLRRRLTKLS